MEAVITISEGILFVGLVYAYYRLCHNREISLFGKIAEMVALYGISFWTILGHLKFIFWVGGIAAIGTIKILTTKKAKIERRNQRLVN